MGDDRNKRCRWMGGRWWLGAALLVLACSPTPPPTSVTVSVDPPSMTLSAGQTQQFTATVTGNSNTAVTWTVVEPGGGTVTASGLYTAPAIAGTYHIKATSVADASKSAQATVAVTASPSVAVSVSPSAVTLSPNGTQQFTATVTGNSNTAVTWTVVDPRGGSVTASGLYTAPASAGTFHVRATSAADGSKFADATVTVTAPPPVTVSVSPSSLGLFTGDTQQFTATVTGSANTAVTWTVVEPGGGTVSATGLYTAPSTSGAFHVRATSAADTSTFADATVTVTARPITDVSVSPPLVSLGTGQMQQFTATVTGTANAAVTWTVVEAAGGSVTASGLYTAPLTAGTFHVKATSVADTSKSAQATVTVTAPPIVVSVSPTSTSLLTGATQQFSATVTGTSNTAVTWTVVEGGGGTVSAGGLYTAPGTPGTFHVKATSVADPSKSAQATVSVAAPVTVSVSPTSVSLITGASQQFTATVTGTSNTAVTWTVVESGGGSVSASGLYTAPGTAGIFHVRATSVADPSKSAQATVTVTLVGITIAPTTAALQPGNTQQFTATVTGTSNTAVTWTVVEAGGGAVSANGLYTAPATAGTYHVQATSVADPSKSAQATVTVAPIVVLIAPSTAEVQPGNSQQFTATVGGTSNTAVTWSVVESGCGTVSASGLYTAPGTAGTCHVKATSVADPSKSAQATVTVAPIVVTVSPPTASLVWGATQQFTATVGGTSNTSVTWSMVEAGCGTVGGSGLYTAPLTSGTCHVKATSAADGTKSAQATVAVVAPVAVTISPMSASVLSGTTQQFTATVTGTSNTSVTWSVVEAGGGAVDASGLYTAPSTPGTYHVKATSVADPTKSAQATATVPPVAITLSPASASVIAGTTQQFTATVTGASNTTVTWTVVETGGGTVSANGLYTAPAMPGTYHVKATSVADGTKSVQATVTVPAVAVTVNPLSVTVQAGTTQQFTATVTGTLNTAVSWSVVEAGGGTVTTTGLYTAPGAARTFHVRATSVADTSKMGEGTVTVTPSPGGMLSPRAYHTATLLQSGKLLVAAGMDGSPNGFLASAETYDPATHQWSASASLATARELHAAALLADGKVLIVGGSGYGYSPPERYDPSTNAWSSAGAMTTLRQYPTATLLTNGKVLVAGGANGSALASAELYDPVTNSWSSAGSMANARFQHTATLLPSGKVLVAGGTGAGAFLKSVEIYDPVTNSWSAATPLSIGRLWHTATLLPSGKVLVAGGQAPTGYATLAELYDPSTNTWTAGGLLITGRAQHTATLLASGKVLVASGYSTSGTLVSSAEVYDPLTNAWTGTGSLTFARYYHTATLFPGGMVLVAGGLDRSGVLSSVETYDPVTGTWSLGGP